MEKASRVAEEQSKQTCKEQRSTKVFVVRIRHRNPWIALSARENAHWWGWGLYGHLTIAQTHSIGRRITSVALRSSAATASSERAAPRAL